MANDSSLLLLTPTAGELAGLMAHPQLRPCSWELCGFGPMVAAARTAMLLQMVRPQRVILCGIAGSYDVERLPIGEAFAFSDVAIDQLGVGQGDGYLPASDCGFLQWEGPPMSIGQELSLAAPAGAAGLLLTTCSASANVSEADDKRRRSPVAMAEDMEGFGVAAACALAGVPLTIIRGVSNRAGDRHKANWRIEAALTAAAELLAQTIHSLSSEEPTS